MNRLQSHRVRRLLAFALALVSSSCAAAPTQLIVSVDTDLAIPAGIDRVEVTVTGPTGTMATEQQALASASSLPLTLAVIPSGDVLGPIDVVAIGRRGATEIVRASARVVLVRGESRVLSLFLLAACAGVPCDDGTTCVAGSCVSNAVSDLPPWTGQPPRIPRDAGPVDAPSMDAPSMDAPGSDAPGSDAPGSDAPGRDVGPDVGGDAGPPCTSAADCDDGVACTMDTCDATSGCAHQPNDAPCDDGEVCTTDSCASTGCVHAANTAACDDGAYCNGFDTCGASTCSVHAGDPCGALTCDEASNRCSGCSAATPCPGPSMGAFSSCDYVDTCDDAAQRSRTVRSFTCTGGECVGADTTQTEACTRSTAGASCGSGSCGGYGACAGFGAVCSETGGNESRSCTDLLCSGGVCGAHMRTESRSCSRSTAGVSCGTTTCDAFGGCGGFPSECAESGGTESRTCTDFACSGGACGSSSRSEFQGCGRSTEALGCGSPSCGAWTACSFTTPCDQDGTQTRTCSGMTCTGGSCTASGGFEETQACSRSTDGMSCDVDRCSPGAGVCSAGLCDGFTNCPEPCFCNAFGSCRMGGGFCAL